MKTIRSYSLMMLAAVICCLLGACSDYKPTGMPDVPDLAKISNLSADVNGRKINLSWTLPADNEIIGVKIIVNADNNSAITLSGHPTDYTLKGLSLGREYLCTVKVMYAGGYVSEGVSVSARMPDMIEGSKVAYLMTAPDIASLPDDDERAAATWFATLEDAEFIQPSQIATLDTDYYPVIWIEIDREGLQPGWENLPYEVSNDATIQALREYSANGGCLYLANMATQLTVPLGIVPEDMGPTVFGSGAGGSGSDVWVINPYLGWDFRDNPDTDQGFYDRTAHAIFKDLTLEDPNNYGYENLPLIGPGHREDHNCLWDCNIYGKGSQPDVIKHFEVTTNSLVLATWGHVRDHCVAGLVEFYSTTSHADASPTDLQPTSGIRTRA